MGDSFHVGLMVDVRSHGEVMNFTNSAPNGFAPPHITIKYTPKAKGMMMYVCAMHVEVMAEYGLERPPWSTNSSC